MSNDTIIHLLALIVAVLTLVTVFIEMGRRNRNGLTGVMKSQHKNAMDAIAETKKETERDLEKVMAAIADTKKQVDADYDIVRREVGEAIGSLRQQLTDLGFFIRDNYVREKDFTGSVVSIKEAVTVMSDKLEARCMRIETEMRNNKHGAAR